MSTDTNEIKDQFRRLMKRGNGEPYFKRKIRKFFWRFVGPFHELTVNWVAPCIDGRVRELEQVVLGQSDFVRATRAELLATTRRLGEIDDAMTANAIHLDKVRNAATILPRFEERLDLLETHLRNVLATQVKDSSANSFPIGAAVCVPTDFGPMIMKPNDLITDFVKRDGSWDQHILPWIKAGAERGLLALDAGAHVGTLACAMATCFSTVHAFEANARTFGFLSANAILRPPGTIFPHNVALYSHETTLSLAAPEKQEVAIDTQVDLQIAFDRVENTGGLTFLVDGSNVSSIQAVPLDSFGFKDVGFIKIDCQGSDGRVLLGAKETIRRCRPIVVFEWEALLAEPHGVSFEAVEALFSELGYELRVAKEHNEKQIDYVALPLDA
ncbi:FkbM family methyltransferase [uncultured Rhodoblastus sp.]|uniref:FkbM family methyltransferase n=1 Tax=uncultured Rhodoblastus sp. TaxID=543037 RepID=UPI0025E3311A|nr:FkbM family methyltransferase [uncultured Rhodoblastus sp.]